MAVVGPHLCGLGGDVLAMVAPPGSTPEALLSVGRAGSGPTRPRLRAEGMTVMPLRRDVRSVPVPGAVDGWLALHGRHGRLPLADVLAPAIELASDGFAASVMLALATISSTRCPEPASSARRDRSRSASACVCPASPARWAPSRSGGRDAFYEGEFGHGLARARPTAISRRRTSPRARRPGAPRCASAPGATTCGPCRPRRRAT